MKRNFYDYLTDKFLMRRFLALILSILLFRTVYTFLAHPEMWDKINQNAAAIFLGILGFITLILKFYFDLRSK